MMDFDGWDVLMYEPHPSPQKRGDVRVWGSSNPPHSCQPPPERGVDDGDGTDGLTQATLISSMIISSNTTKAISEASPTPSSCHPEARLPV